MKRLRAFTLIETFVVIASTTVLTTFLLPPASATTSDPADSTPGEA